MQAELIDDKSLISSFFVRVDKYEHLHNMLKVSEVLEEHPPPCPPTPPPKRGVGRPPLKREAAEELVLTAAADTVKEQLPKQKRGKYTQWFNSPYINDIIVQHARSGGSARRTVQTLQNNAPDDRYERLSHSTVATWFDEKGVLKEHYQLQLQAGYAVTKYHGPCPVLATAKGAEDAICDILLKLREAGTPLNSHIIRWVMRAVLEEKHPEVLDKLTHCS
jgi:hypothetical protein